MPERDLHLEVTSDADSRGLSEAARDTGKLRDQVKGLGGDMASTKRESEKLQAEITRTQTKVRDLGVEFARTGDKSLFGDLRKERSFLAQLEKIRQELERVDKLGANLSVGGGGGGLGGLLGKIPAPSGAGGVLIPALGLMIAASAPEIGALVSSAMLGAVGTGGIIGGIALAAHDPRVKSAWSEFGHNAMRDLRLGGSTFVEPLVGGARDLGREWERIGPQINASLADLATHTRPLIAGFGGFVEHLLPGLQKGLVAAGPIIDQLAEDLPSLGDAFGTMFESFAQAGPGAREFFHDLLDVTGKTLVSVGEVSEALTKVYHAIPPGGTGTLGAILNAWNEAHPQAVVRDLKDITGGTGELRTQLFDAARAADALNGELSKLFSDRFNKDEARLGMLMAIQDLKKSLGENQGAFGEKTTAGLADRQSFLDAIQAVARWRDTLVSTGTPIAQANVMYEAQLKLIMGIGKQAGIARGELEKLARTYTLRVVLTTQGIRYTGTYLQPTDLQPHRAAGGPVMANMPYTINERGNETVSFPANGTVHPANLTPATTSGAAPLNLFGGGLGQVVFEWLRTEIAARGGTLAVLGLRS